MDVTGTHDEYCRAIEAYLCRKNDGHLIRIVGPAFERVLSWAAQGVPLKVAYRGIDRYFERYYAKGTRRRPVRIEFCEADVLDVFDDWRRAVGVSLVRETAQTAEGDEAEPEEARHRTSLKAHLERALARLQALPATAPALVDAMAPVVRGLEELSTGGSMRGEARRAAIARLRALDESLLDSARQQIDAATMSRLLVEADEELAPFRTRMPAAAYEQSRHACVDRLVRETFHLPIIVFE